MSIDWHALGEVFAVTLVATIGLVGLFTAGVVALTKHGSASGGGGAVLARTGGYACFAVCAAAVSYGIYLIVA